MKLITVLASGLAFVVSAASGGEVRFSTPPTAKKAGDKTVITFAVGGRTDVEVAILDAKGKVVRHLAAGVLGAEKDPPKPLRKGLGS